VDLNPKYKPTVLADARSLPFRASVFDGVYLSHILEHVTDPENILKEVRRVAEVGKRVTITFPNFACASVLMAWFQGFCWDNQRSTQKPPYIISPGLERAYSIVYGSHSVGEYDVHHVPLSLPLLGKLLEEFGFRVESARGDMIRLPFRRFRLMRSLSKALGRVIPSRAGIITIVARKV
jgi:SAM-dependent methyltransferase